MNVLPIAFTSCLTASERILNGQQKRTTTRRLHMVNAGNHAWNNVDCFNITKGNLNKMTSKIVKIWNPVSLEYFMSHACYNEWRGRKGVVFCNTGGNLRGRVIFGVVVKPMVYTKTKWVKIPVN